MGDAEVEKMTAAFENARSLLADRALPGLEWDAWYTPGATHSTNARLSAPRALARLFND